MTNPPPTLEKVARAICGVNCFRQRILGEPCLNADRTNGPCKANETQLALGGPLQAAQAALQALRQVDEGTVIVGLQELPFGPSSLQHARNCFRAQIDHILSQGGEG